MTRDLLVQFLNMYAVGLGCGIILSVVPFVIGEIINFSLRLLKGG